MKLRRVSKRVLAGALACGMLLTTFTGCGKGDDKKSTQVEGVTLTVAIPEKTRVADYNTNDMTIMIEEALGVNLEFTSYPSANYESKLNVMVMSGDKLPDIIIKPGTQFKSWIKEGAILDLSEYFDNPEYSKYFREAQERTGEDILKYVTQPDGKIYQIPFYIQDPGQSVQQHMWIYEPWLEAYGKGVPQTTEEFYDFCKFVATTDLNGNGKQDEIGLSGTGIGGWFDFLMSAFVYAHESSEFRIVEDGQVQFAFMQDEWKEGLKYIKKLMDEGLIPKETLTQKSDQYKSMLYAETPLVSTFVDWCYMGTDIERRSEYTYIPALEGPEGVKLAMNQPIEATTGYGAVISADCENPLAAFLVCDYLFKEEVSLTNRYGKQGVDWDYWEDAKDKVEDPEAWGAQMEGYDIKFITYDTNFWYGVDVQNSSYMEVGPIIRDKDTIIGRGMITKPSTKAEEIALYNEQITWECIAECEKYAPEEVWDYAPLTDEEERSITAARNTMRNYVQESIGAFLTGTKDIDKDWDAYLKELETIGVDKILKIYQTAYSRVH